MNEPIDRAAAQPGSGRDRCRRHRRSANSGASAPGRQRSSRSGIRGRETARPPARAGRRRAVSARAIAEMQPALGEAGRERQQARHPVGRGPSASVSALAQHHVAAALAVDRLAPGRGAGAARRGTASPRRAGRRAVRDSRPAGRRRRPPGRAPRRRAARRTTISAPAARQPVEHRGVGEDERVVARDARPAARAAAMAAVRRRRLSGRLHGRASADQPLDVETRRHRVGGARDEASAAIGRSHRRNQAEMAFGQTQRRGPRHARRDRADRGRWRASAASSNGAVAPPRDPVEDHAGERHRRVVPGKAGDHGRRRGALRRASTTSTTGQPVSRASSAVEPASPSGPVPSNRPITPSHTTMSAARSSLPTQRRQGRRAASPRDRD